jgi:hypothetical protein
MAIQADLVPLPDPLDVASLLPPPAGLVPPPEQRPVRKPHKRYGVRSCLQCGATKTPQWREGPHGPKTLCNACG